jgi:nicotinamide phosphoribosyltransferase
MLEPNFAADTDFYKIPHHLMYRPGLTRVYEYGEARIGAKFDISAFFGMQMILNDHFVGPVITREKIEEAEQEAFEMGGNAGYFNKKMWNYILNKYGGYLPLSISAVPEGTQVPVGNVLFDITATDVNCMPLVGHSEPLLMHIWYPITVVSQLLEIKKAVRPLVIESGTLESEPYMVHDFGLRGVKDWVAAGRGGAAALLLSDGTDNGVARRMLKYHYGATRGKSVWATEHSVATSFGLSLEEERQYLIHQLDNCPDDCTMSIVIDSKDSFNFIENVVGFEEITERIKARTGRVVFRPDSGDPEYVVNRVLNLLANIFGFYYNGKQFKVLNHNVGVLQGDGMDKDSIPQLYRSIMANKWSTDNLVTGSGGGLLEKMNRDTQRFAIKASKGTMVGGTEIDIHKDPATMPDKASKKGYLKLTPTGNTGFTTISSSELTKAQFKGYVDAKKEIFKDGVLIKRYDLAEVLQNLNF